MDVILTFGSRDFHGRLSTYKVTKEMIPAPVVTTLDYGEYTAAPKYRDVITISLYPQTDAQANLDFLALSAGVGSATYTDPTHATANPGEGVEAQTVTNSMRVVTNLDAVFGLRSADGNRYYKGGEIVLRAVQPG